MSSQRRKDYAIRKIVGQGYRPWHLAGDFYGWSTGKLPTGYLKWVIDNVTETLWRDQAEIELFRRGQVALKPKRHKR